MDILLFFLFFAFIFSLSFLGHWIDNKYHVQVIRWINCEVSSPFRPSPSTKEPLNTSDDLRVRIENLEKIVTDSRWELNEKLKKL